ncbi:MAG: polysaccharide biosynthesis tyrosine autokinase, partial [bacterium]
MNRRMSQEEVRQVKNFLDEQLRIVQKQLTDSENALKQFQEKERVVALSQETQELIKNLAEFEGLYNEALTELNSNHRRLEYINSQLGHNKENFDIESISSSPYLEQLKMQLAALEAEKASLLANLISENIDYKSHPKYKKLEEQIDMLTNRFKDQISELAAKEIINPVAMSEKLWARKIEVEAEIEALKPKVKSLKGIVDEYSSHLMQLPEKSLKLAQLERASKVDEKIYIMMKEKYQESQITEVGQLGDVRIIDPAKPPKNPIKPRKRLNLMLGMMVGLGLGVGLTFLLEAMDNSVRVMEDLTRIGLPALGAIPEIRQQEALKRIKVMSNGNTNGTTAPEEVREMAARLITHFAPKSPISEAYRSFRTNIQFTKIDKPLQTLLVTSPGPGEGKSTTVANLAITMAQMGSKVLLVDADLRRPILHSIFKLDRRIGLTNTLVGRVSVDDAINETEIENLSIMPCGTLPPNPSELLGSAAMKNLIEELKSKFDIVLFDSPPVIAVTDAVVLCNKLDGVVLVVKSGQTDRNAASHAYSLLKNVSTNLLGGLLNGVNVESMYGSYYYYYHYYYYYY